MRDRFDDGRRVVDRTVDDGRRVVGRTVGDGRRLVETGLNDSRRVLADRFGDGRRAVDAGVNVSAALWPTVLLAAGAGAAFWWWTQYSRGRDHSAATAHAEGGEGPHIPSPELVMAHSPAPPPEGPEAVDASDADLVEPAQDLMLHAPVDAPAPPSAKTPRAKKPAAEAGSLAALAAQASEPAGVERSLAVQGAATSAAGKTSKRSGPNGATAGAAKAPRKGPTVM